MSSDWTKLGWHAHLGLPQLPFQLQCHAHQSCTQLQSAIALLKPAFQARKLTEHGKDLLVLVVLRRLCEGVLDALVMVLDPSTPWIQREKEGETKR